MAKVGRHGIGPSPKLLELEAKARAIGRIIGGACPPGVGFSLQLFDFGDSGFCTYISNAQRDDMIKAMKELIGKLEASTQ